MASNRNMRPVIVTCFLSAALLIMMGGCSPPLPKTWLQPSDGTMSNDRLHVTTVSPLTIRP